MQRSSSAPCGVRARTRAIHRAGSSTGSGDTRSGISPERGVAYRLFEHPERLQVFGRALGDEAGAVAAAAEGERQGAERRSGHPASGPLARKSHRDSEFLGQSGECSLDDLAQAIVILWVVRDRPRCAA